MDNPLVQPDPGLFIWTIVTFLVLLALLAKFAWRPLLAALETRQNAIRKSLDDAAAGEAGARAAATPSRRRSSSRRASRPTASSRRAAPTPTGSARRCARRRAAEADGIVKNAERQIQLETSRALQQIRHEAVDLSVMIASKILQRNVSKEDNERLIDEALKQIESRRN